MFKSDFHSVAPFSQVVGKVCVLFIREYLKFFPEVREEEGAEARREREREMLSSKSRLKQMCTCTCYMYPIYNCTFVHVCTLYIHVSNIHVYTCMQDYSDDEVYVCETRYSHKTKSFKKIKVC